MEPAEWPASPAAPVVLWAPEVSRVLSNRIGSNSTADTACLVALRLVPDSAHLPVSASIHLVQPERPVSIQWNENDWNGWVCSCLALEVLPAPVATEFPALAAEVVVPVRADPTTLAARPKRLLNSKRSASTKRLSTGSKPSGSTRPWRTNFASR